jgi:hypothetical protein
MVDRDPFRPRCRSAPAWWEAPLTVALFVGTVAALALFQAGCIVVETGPPPCRALPLGGPVHTCPAAQGPSFASPPLLEPAPPASASPVAPAGPRS